jgi:DNA repair protein RadC
MNPQQNLNMVAEITLQYHPIIPLSSCPSIRGPEDAYKIFLQNWDAGTLQLQEEFKVMLLNRDCKVLGIVTTSKGSLNGTIADPRLVFATALKGAASSIILAHNHPSGALRPSYQDREITRKLVQIGTLLDIEVVDHIIVTTESFYSFADNNDVIRKRISPE